MAIHVLAVVASADEQFIRECRSECELELEECLLVGKEEFADRKSADS